MKKPIIQTGFDTYTNVLSSQEVEQYVDEIQKVPSHNSNFRKGKGLFAIRNLLGEIPSLQALLPHANIQSLLQAQFSAAPVYCIKAIYFDKPPQSNWVVNWHQDLTINVKQRPTQSPAGFINWIQKSGFWSVQPPLEYLQNILTLRIHLDNCTVTNGTLKVLEGSHKMGITNAQMLNTLKNTCPEIICEVPKGGIFAMSPLLWHASSKNQSTQHRRVIHLEFSNKQLPESLEWSEKYS